MSSVIGRARESAMAGGGGDYLDNNMLIANQLVFDIVDVVDDRNGGFNGNDRWMVKVEPHYDGESDPTGLITLNDNPARRKFMAVIQSELDGLEKSGDEVFIGPCVLVKLKGRNYRYIEIVEWDKEANKPILPDGAVLAGAGADQAADFRARRPRGETATAQPSTPSTSAEAASGPVGTPTRSRSFAPADGGNAAPRSAVVPAAAPVATPAPVPTPPPVPVPPVQTATDRGASTGPGTSSASSIEFPKVKDWARSQGYEVAKVGRVKVEVAEAYERAKAAALGTGDYGAPAPEPSPTAGRARRARGQTDAESRETTSARTEKPSEVHTRPAQVGAGAPSRAARPPDGGAHNAREVVWAPGTAGSTTCPVCNELVHDRVFPKGDGSGEYSIVHKCSTGEMFTLDAVLDAAE